LKNTNLIRNKEEFRIDNSSGLLEKSFCEAIGVRLIPLTQVGQHIALVHGARTLTEPIPARVSERRELRRVSRGAAAA